MGLPTFKQSRRIPSPESPTIFGKKCNDVMICPLSGPLAAFNFIIPPPPQTLLFFFKVKGGGGCYAEPRSPKAEQTGSIAAANFGKVFPGDRSRVPSHSFQPVGSKRIEEGGGKEKRAGAAEEI